MRARTHKVAAMNTLNEKIKLHHKLANCAVHRAIAAHKKYARGLNGTTTPPVITVMAGGESSYWVVQAAKERAVPCDGPSRLLGTLNLRVFDVMGENDQPLIEVGDE